MAGQFAIVTGASNGIGLSLAKELASRGYDLAICSAGERLPSAAQEVRSKGTQVTEIQADLATREGVKEFWDRVQSMGRTIDVACINAGVGVGGLFCGDGSRCRTEYGRPELRGHCAAREIRGSSTCLRGMRGRFCSQLRLPARWLRREKRFMPPRKLLFVFCTQSSLRVAGYGRIGHRASTRAHRH